MNPILLVVAKAPVAGVAKTRLCPPATLGQAAEIAAAALLDTIDAVVATPATIPVLALTGDLARAAGGRRIERALRGWTVLPQRGDSFADRLAAAHADVAARFPARAVLQIGMDTPQLNLTLLSGGLRRLARGAEALLGPAVDGGWWALGLRDPTDAQALRAVPTSRADTGERTREALCERGLRVGTLPLLSDVDTMADAVAVAARTAGRFAAAVHAVAALPPESQLGAGQAPPVRWRPEPMAGQRVRVARVAAGSAVAECRPMTERSERIGQLSAVVPHDGTERSGVPT